MLVYLAVASGLLQALGYIFYLRGVLHHGITPNPTTWLMFAYGTFLLGVLEYSRGAEWELLLLPAICAILSVVVALICWKRGTLRWPKGWENRTVFIADILLTIGYCGAWAFVTYGLVSESERALTNLVFLICSNLTTLTAFTPLTLEAKRNPKGEQILPWTIWTSAYAVLGIATYLEHGWGTELMIYPVLNAVLHASVAWLVRNRQSK